MDEIERSVDAPGRLLLLAAAAEVADRGGAVLWATHDDEVVAAVDRELRLEKGRLG